MWRYPVAPEEIVAKVFGAALSEVRDDTSNKTLAAWDSLGHITLIIELESTYGISLSPGDLFNMTSVASIKRILSSHGVTWWP